MRKRISTVFSAVMLSLAAIVSHASTREFSVQVSAAVQSAPAQIILSWPQDSVAVPDSYTVYRRAPGTTSWGTGIALAGKTTSYADRNVSVGTPYEYQVVKQASGYTGYGYIYAGINIPLTENRGRLLVVVDNTYAAELANELARLQKDLVGDGWTVTRLDVNRGDAVTHVKGLIRAQYLGDPANVKGVFLFGHVPVPYSGDIVPDGHYANHRGAWPCDGYYGDMDGSWTDETVNDTTAADPRNHNVPGDGKFDQSSFPAPLKLMVGRVDLANMPGRLSLGGAPTFPSEVELLRNYLNKDHNFRNKVIAAPERGIVGDYFGEREGEAFAASGWRNFAPFFGASNITALSKEGTWIPTLRTNAYLFAYGCGSGSYTSIGGIGSIGKYDDGVTTELVQNDVKAVFTLLYGSWLGDWDSEDNIQRAVLATRDYGLTCSWSGRPHWFMQHMALGTPIGFSARVTQNDGFTGLYRNEQNNCAGWTHIALMGDPTLRMHVVAPATEITATENGNAVQLSWQPSKDAVKGYNVYRATNPNGPFTRINESLVAGTNFTDANAAAGNYVYMLRAVKIETSGSGTYFNASEGAFATLGNIANEFAGSTNTTPVQASKSAPEPTRAASDNIESGRKLSPTGAGTGSGVDDTVWFDDSLPSGAITGSDGGDGWNWISANPTPLSGSVAHQSNVNAGFHQHYFDWAYWGMLSVNTGDALFAYVYLDPANVPSEIMLNWNDTSWEHRAYWGANNLNFGTDGTASRHYMGPLPPAGQWVRLEVPASALALEGTALKGMAFTLYGGRATWDYVGKSTSVVGTNLPPGGDTNPPPTTTTNPPVVSSFTNAAPSDTNFLFGSTAADDIGLRMPKVGDTGLHVLTPTLLELQLVNTAPQGSTRVSQWDFVNNNNNFSAPPASAFTVTANGQTIAVQAVGFKRRPLYAPLATYDLRIENSLYLQLSSPISDSQVVEVKNPNGTLWGTNMQFVATADPLRYSPAIHVNQEGYGPTFAKKAMVGYYIGNLGEMNVPLSSGFVLVDAKTGTTAFSGSLVQRVDSGWTYSPAPYQKVYEADFTSFSTPGQYRLVVPGMGASLPFSISDGVAMDFARAYALGLYEQRCGTNLSLPWTRFTHDDCHVAPASIPWPASSYAFTWTTISNYSLQTNPDNPPQSAPKINANTQLFPFVKTGTVDVSGGHHDAGDYSKYMTDSTALIHNLMFAVDSLPGVASLDNLGIPESGDGIADLLQEAKWEADYVAKMQDSDGGFYFIVYPVDTEYESDVTPDHGHPQVVWPKTSTATASAVAALAQCASSPAFKAAYPQAAADYLAKAKLGCQFLTNAIARYGKDGIYQKITHYGDVFADHDELAWAACEMFLATGDQSIHATFKSWFPDPTDSATFRWGWWRMSQCWGNAVRDYAFAVKSRRLSASQIDSAYLAKCITVITNAGDDAMNWSKQSAYGTSFPSATKAVQGAGWYFSSDQAFDITVAYQFDPNPDYLSAIIANMNYEGGCNPVNASYITGLGWKQQRDIVSQFALKDRRKLPPSGIPIGNVQSGFSYLGSYGTSLAALCFPQDGGAGQTPFYDRWADSWNVQDEFVILNSARSLASLAFLAAQTPLKTQAWKSVQGQIAVPSETVSCGVPITVSLTAPGVDLTGARIMWEARDQEPFMGETFTFSPKNNGTQWVEAEAQLPDGRHVFAEAEFNADSPNIVWVDDSLPAGAVPGSDGGDAWNWVGSNPSPVSGSLASQSTIASGEHQHFFDWATDTLSVGTGTVLYAYVYLDPAHPPTEVMMEWNNGDWNHIAYWGANSIGFGTDGTPSRRYMGPLPPLGQWVQLKVPASDVALEGSTVKGMGFCIYNGRATWDAAGLLNPNVGTNSTSTNSSTVVSVTATNATRVGPKPGHFKFSRTGDTSKSLMVAYSLSGTAVPGVDYQTPPQLNLVDSPAVTIPAGASSVSLDISPATTTNIVGSQTVVATVSGGTDYSISAPAEATLTIEGNTVSAPALTMQPTGPSLSWNSTSGAVYRVCN